MNVSAVDTLRDRLVEVCRRRRIFKPKVIWSDEPPSLFVEKLDPQIHGANQVEIKVFVPHGVRLIGIYPDVVFVRLP